MHDETPASPPVPVFAPDILLVPEDWKDRMSWQFESFVMHAHTDVCSTCSSVSSPSFCALASSMIA